MISSKECLPTFYLFGMNAAWFLCLIVVFLSFPVVFLGVSERAKMVANTTTFAEIMTNNGHDQQQTMPVCSLYIQGLLFVCLLCLIVGFVAFLVVFLCVSDSAATVSTQQLLL